MNNIESKCYLPALIGILLVLSNAISSISCSFRDRYSERVPTYKITVPRKVSADGTFLSHYIPHFYDGRRKKRDLSADEVHYIIPVEGVEHHIHLWPSTDFLSPGLVVEHHTLKGNTSHISVRKMRDTQCHYRGIVRGVDQSSVSLSTCYGLAGQVKTPQTNFIIEPLLRENTADEYHRHYIYKREDVAAGTKNITNCGTKGKFNEAWEQRMDWERKYGEQIEKSMSSSIFGDTSYATHLRRSKRAGESCAANETSTDCPHDPVECPLRTPHFLEVMVCVDYKLEKEFEQDIETFISTVFNMVTANFHDETAGYQIHVKLVRLLYLSYTIPRLDVSRFSPSGLLQNFCDWQLELNPLLESHPNHHDIAVFITSFEPCQGNVLGLTNMASVCRLDKACAVVSEEGLLLANIITHQLGHSLGAEHDDGGVGGCAGEEPDGTRYHMSPFISLSSSAWSTCSRQCLAQFIETRISWCMADPPDEHDFRSPNILPGQVYDAIKQCSLNFKMKTLACRTGDFCKTLYCQISDSKCATTGDPPADGTPCAMNMWCFNGYCVHRGQRPGAVHGHWGPWTPWSTCTRSCGGGVQSKYRACDNPPPSNGGRYCFGNWMTFRMCSIKACAGYVPTFLQVQCKMTDKRPYRGHYFMWDHIRTFFEDMKCTLVCINEIKQVSIRSPVVVDGTPCEPGTNNVCIQGLCRKVGCDFVIESKSKEDMCGTCHGPGLGCKLVQGLFDEPNIEGIVPILQLPARTSMIYLREVDQSACYIIISSPVNSTFYLNGPTSRDHLPGEFNCAGATGVYDDKQGISRIFVKGPIEAAITVSIKCQDEASSLSRINKGIRYQYALPESDNSYVPSYRWAYLYWESCTRACGGGTQRAKAACLERNGGEVEDKYCSEFSKPVDIIRPCNIKACTAKWWVGSWSECDCQDGEGIMTRIVLCMKSMKEDNSIAKVVKDKECCNQPKPRVQRPCNDERSMRRRKRQKPVDPMTIVTLPSPSAYKKSYINNDFDWNEDYLQSLSDESRQHPVGFADPGGAGGHYSTERDRIERKKMNKKKARRRKKLHGYRNNVPPVLPLINSSSAFEEESQTAAPKQVKPVGKSANRDMDASNQDDREDTSSKPIIYAKGSKNLNLKSSDDDLQTLDCSAVSLTTPACPINLMSFSSYLSTEVIRTTNSTSQSTCTSDFFFDHVLQGNKGQYQTTCSPENNEIEPADLGPLLESANNSLYKMIIISIIPDRDTFPKTDLEIQTFGDSAFWPIGSALNTTYISGDTIFKILQEARRRGTKPPLIEPDTG